MIILTTYKIEKIFETLKQHNPAPTTELVYNNHFELLISVILSAQATDISVNRATLSLYKSHNTPNSILTLGEDGLIYYIKSIGLFRTKAKNIIKTCKLLIENFNSIIPNTREALESLPGVGRKTANVILNTAFGKPTMAVDTHIFRVSNRIGLSNGNTPLKVELDLVKSIPKKYLHDAHHWLILHGRYICVARKPKCSQCPISKWCLYYPKTAVDS